MRAYKPIRKRLPFRLPKGYKRTFRMDHKKKVIIILFEAPNVSLFQEFGTGGFNRYILDWMFEVNVMVYLDRIK